MQWKRLLLCHCSQFPYPFLLGRWFKLQEGWYDTPNGFYKAKY